MKKFFRITGLILLILGALFVYYHYFWVFARGVKAGQLNNFSQKGFLFKTYEGRLIQAGFEGKNAGTIQSYEFRFSVTNKRVADTLMANSGKEFDLHYEEYLATVPWRGATIFVVDSILSMRDSRQGVLQSY
jgi:hypothetical protein